MCGIAGFFSARGIESSARGTLEDMTRRLRHRGPDGTGAYIDTSRGIAMGHARLSIIDLQTGDQPLFGREGSEAVFTGNGEFYDYKRIRANLICDGHRFRTKSDSEIALHLYEEKGLDFVDKLRGEFGFALYDGREDRLVLVRDRFGVKPLFYTVKDGTIYWASEIKALFAVPQIERKFSQQAVLHQLMHTMVPGSTAFEGVHALKPGHMLVISKDGASLDIREKRYWDLDFPRAGGHDTERTVADFAEAVRDELLEAVQLRLEADVPVGCYLSGGIDSCSMLGLASAVQQSPVKAYTISFDHDAYDEAEIAREMARATNADQDVLNLTARELYGSNYVNTMWHAERTFYNTLGVAKWCMSRRVHESGYKVVVTGEGADELFGGYPAFKRDMLLHGMKDAPEAERIAHMRAMTKSNSLFRGAILAEEETSHRAMEDVCGFTPSWIQPWIRTLAVARPLLHDDIVDALADYDPIEAIAGSFDRGMIEGRHPLDISQYTWSKTMLECQILNWGGDRVDMANAMESRPAFLDHHVAALATRIPPEYRIKGNIEKHVLREAMVGILPEVLYKRQKFAFMAPPGHTEDNKRSAVDELIETYVNDDAIRRAGVFDLDRLSAFLREYRTDTDPVSLTRKDALLNHIIGLQILHH
ncbi:asparagine synthase (glutamine-hydrolyzing), partial [candidate division GN15 bacterium]|nr:asparagine synthase (glutamine-hydrolyzing) [candidate division GN15 bacterium]